MPPWPAAKTAKAEGPNRQAAERPRAGRRQNGRGGSLRPALSRRGGPSFWCGRKAGRKRGRSVPRQRNLGGGRKAGRKRSRSVPRQWNLGGVGDRCWEICPRDRGGGRKAGRERGRSVPRQRNLGGVGDRYWEICPRDRGGGRKAGRKRGRSVPRQRNLGGAGDRFNWESAKPQNGSSDWERRALRLHFVPL